MDGALADDPKAWRQVLQLAADVKTSNGADLIRLHRRATLRFPLDQIQQDQKEDIVGIWLAFASIHAKLGMTDETRRTCRYMENQKLSLGASYYVEVSRMEREYDRQKSEEILIRGLKENAEPRALLQQELDTFRECTDPVPKIPALSPSNTSKASSLSPRKRKLDSASSPKRHKTEEGYVITGEERGSEEPRPAKTEKDADVASQPSTSKTKNPSNTSLTSAKPAVVTKPVNPSNKASAALRSRPTRLSASRLGRKGLSGKAKRVVETDASMLEESESEPESTCGETSINLGTLAAPLSQAKPSRIKKIDLGYMWEWDPNAREKTQEMKASKPTMEKIEESSASSGQATNASSHATNRSGETTTTTNASSIQSRKSAGQTSDDLKDVSRQPLAENTATKVEEAPAPSSTNAVQSTSPHQELLAHANLEFLPLVHENNILRVNGSSYAKLGVIGKGGSCKVYRALSKKCSVVAIKKVKLEGMDKKAIDGYANEISLLKRLRGNPAIIQMYDSEVDLARKSIFVVMELGEADLNHILQQRALSGGCRSLNMNFIRLTWQQMLSAVHCIHEERIIHSDLKPANFLFVRGALKLIDFGIAKAIQSDDTTNIYRESHIGTLNYMSPEAILDTETGSNGPRMRIGRVSRNDAVRLRMSRISTNRYLSTHDAGFRCLVPRLHPLRNGTWQDAIR